MANREFEIDMQDLLSHFDSLDDPRAEVNLRHPFVSVIMISIMAILAGAGGPTAIALWAENKQKWLSKYLTLPHGIPKKDVYRRVLMTINPQAFQACYSVWLQSLYDHAQEENGKTQPLLNIDGKTLRRSHDRSRGLGALHSVSVWAADYGMTLAQVACEEKSNEITAIPEVLKLVDIKGAIITIDAMGTQKKIAKQIVDAGGDYVLATVGCAVHINHGRRIMIRVPLLQYYLHIHGTHSVPYFAVYAESIGISPEFQSFHSEQ